ncbi:MAG TPA: hypothetical protein VGN81_03700 [Pseudonocardiaceae bacterium]
MSGPYPPQGYPQQPAQGGWGGQVGGGPSGPYGPSNYPGGWQQQPQDQPAWHGSAPEPTPPPRKRNTGQIIAVILASLVIIGGVATGIVLLRNNHQAQQQANGPTTTPVATSQQQQQQTSDAPGATNASGRSSVTVSAGQCVTASTDSSSYKVTKLAQCGSATSDFVLNKTVSQVSGCAAQQYVVITGPAGAVYCFTIDAKAGDCVNSFYLKAPCGATAAFTVLKTEAGPGSDSSCRTVAGAQRWVPAGYPSQVACLGPSGSS